MTFFSGSATLSAAPPIQTQVITELHELKDLLHRVQDVLSNIDDRLAKLEQQI